MSANETRVQLMTVAQVKELAGQLKIAGRSKMKSDELRTAVIAELDRTEEPMVDRGLTIRDEVSYANIAATQRPQATQAKPHIGKVSIEVNTLVDNAEVMRRASMNVAGSAAPMDSSKRQAVYEADRNGGKMSARQRRRMHKKNNKNFSA